MYVVVPPTIKTQPTQQIVEIYQNATFYCEAEGFQVTYLWKRCDENDENVRTVVARSANLSFSNAIPFDNGKYYCEAINNGGITSSNPVRLEVKGNHYTHQQFVHLNSIPFQLQFISLINPKVL